MGTSVSQSSPRNTNWSPVHAGYENEFIPKERIISEIWRASENEEAPISQVLASDVIYQCYSAVNNSDSFQEAVQKFSDYIRESKSNSIVAEFAKRAIPASYQSENPAGNWTARFFSEITNYVISRDVSGFVGENYRNKSVRDMVDFKKSVSGKVSEIISSESVNIRSQKDWNSFIDQSISKLKSTK